MSITALHEQRTRSAPEEDLLGMGPSNFSHGNNPVLIMTHFDTLVTANVANQVLRFIMASPPVGKLMFEIEAIERGGSTAASRGRLPLGVRGELRPDVQQDTKNIGGVLYVGIVENPIGEGPFGIRFCRAEVGDPRRPSTKFQHQSVRFSHNNINKGPPMALVPGIAIRQSERAWGLRTENEKAVEQFFWKSGGVTPDLEYTYVPRDCHREAEVYADLKGRWECVRRKYEGRISTSAIRNSDYRTRMLMSVGVSTRRHLSVMHARLFQDRPLGVVALHVACKSKPSDVICVMAFTLNMTSDLEGTPDMPWCPFLERYEVCERYLQDVRKWAFHSQMPVRNLTCTSHNGVPPWIHPEGFPHNGIRVAEDVTINLIPLIFDPHGTDREFLSTQSDTRDGLFTFKNELFPAPKTDLNARYHLEILLGSQKLYSVVPLTEAAAAFVLNEWLARGIY